MTLVDYKTQLTAHAIWTTDRVKDHSTKIGSGVTPDGGSAGYLEIGIPLLRSQNVHPDGLRLDDVAYISEETHESMSGSKVQPGDVLLNITGASIGRCTYAPETLGEANVNQHVCIIRPKGRVHYKFLSFVLSAPWGQDQILSTFTGASRQGLSSRNLGDILIPLPPFCEQSHIAGYLEASCAAIDKALSTKQQQLETLDVLRKSIIQKAVTQGLNPDVEMKDSGVSWFGRIPRHWSSESLKRATKRIQTGSTPPTSSPEYFENGTIHWFAPESFGKSIELGEPKKLIHESAVADNKLRVFPPDTVLFVGIGATIGKVAVLKSQGSANQQIVGITCDHRMLGSFLAYQLKNYEAIIPRIAQYTTLPILNQTKVGYLNVLRPPISEQQAICDYLEAKEIELTAIEKLLETQIDTLTAYRKSLIHECVTGQRRITEADVTHAQAHV